MPLHSRTLFFVCFTLRPHSHLSACLPEPTIAQDSQSLKVHNLSNHFSDGSSPTSPTVEHGDSSMSSLRCATQAEVNTELNKLEGQGLFDCEDDSQPSEEDFGQLQVRCATYNDLITLNPQWQINETFAGLSSKSTQWMYNADRFPDRVIGMIRSTNLRTTTWSAFPFLNTPSHITDHDNPHIARILMKTKDLRPAPTSTETAMAGGIVQETSTDGSQLGGQNKLTKENTMVPQFPETKRDRSPDIWQTFHNILVQVCEHDTEYRTVPGSATKCLSRILQANPVPTELQEASTAWSRAIEDEAYDLANSILNHQDWQMHPNDAERAARSIIASIQDSMTSYVAHFYDYLAEASLRITLEEVNGLLNMLCLQDSVIERKLYNWVHFRLQARYSVVLDEVTERRIVTMVLLGAVKEDETAAESLKRLKECFIQLQQDKFAGVDRSVAPPRAWVENALATLRTERSKYGVYLRSIAIQSKRTWYAEAATTATKTIDPAAKALPASPVAMKPSSAGSTGLTVRKARAQSPEKLLLSKTSKSHLPTPIVNTVAPLPDRSTSTNPVRAERSTTNPYQTRTSLSETIRDDGSPTSTRVPSDMSILERGTLRTPRHPSGSSIMTTASNPGKLKRGLSKITRFGRDAK